MPTSLLMACDVLQKEAYAPENIYFVEFSETANDLGQVLSAIPDKSLLIVDEVQYCKKWKDLLKVFYDTYPQKRVIVTGSSRLDIEKKRRASCWQVLQGKIQRRGGGQDFGNVH